MKEIVTEEELFEKYCKIIVQYANEHKYNIIMSYESEFGSRYYKITKSPECGYSIKVRISNHPSNSEDKNNVQFRVDMKSLKRPVKNLRDKIFRSLDKAMRSAGVCYVRHAVDRIK